MTTKNISGARKTLAILALFLSTCCTMGDMVIVPIVSNLYGVFNNEALVNAIVSAPALIGLVICVIAGRLVDVMDKKLIMVGGFAVFTVSSVFGAAVENVWYVLICRLLATGLAWALTSTAALAIIAEMYTDEAKHGAVVGWYNAVMAAIGAALSFVAGNLALNGWQAAYRTYWIAVPILVMLIVFLPSAPPAAAEKTEIKEESPNAMSCIKSLMPLNLQVFFIAASYYVIVYMIAVFVTDTGIGNEAYIGTLSSLGTIASCVACMSYGFVLAKLKKAVAIPSFFLLGAGFMLMYFVPSAGVVAVCCTVMGAAWGIFFSYFYSHCTEIVPENLQGTAIGIIGAVNGFASFVAPYMLTGAISAVKAESSLTVWPIFGVICLIVAVISSLAVVKKK